MQNKLSKKELNDIIEWDIANWKYALDFWESYYPIKPGMKVLAIGERRGGLSLFFAKKGCQVICTDYRDFPDSTKKLHKNYQVDNSIRYEQLDMRQIQFPDETFDIVVFKSVIGAIEHYEDQQKSLAEIHRVLKKGGAFLFAENSSASKFHRFMRKLFVKWEAKWRYVPDKEFKEWGQKYSASFSDKKGFISLFGRREWQRKILSIPDKIISTFVPKSWKYIYFGVCIKWGVSSVNK